MQKSLLILQIKQKVETFFSHYSHIAKKQKIYAKFDRTLFSQDFENVEFYFTEIQQSLAQLEKIDDNDIQKYNFYSAKLVGQCKALTEALKWLKPQEKKQFQHSKTNLLSIQAQRENQRIELNKLPPRECLSKYYEALQALNMKLEQQRDRFTQATSLQEKQVYSQQMMITQQRKDRCMEAIEQLEEYLN